MSEKNYSVRFIASLIEDCLSDGIESISESELLEMLGSRPTKRAADGFTAEQIAEIRRIANDVYVGATE